MLLGVLNAFYDAVSLLLRHQVEKRAILENLDLVVLALDETIDNGCVDIGLSLLRALSSGGRTALELSEMSHADCHSLRRSIILEVDAVAIASRVSRPKPDAGVNLAEITLNEATIMQVSVLLLVALPPCCPKLLERLR